MRKKYTLKAKQSTKEVFNSTSHFPEQKTNTDSSGFGSFLKFIVWVAVITIIAIPVSSKIKTLHHEKIGEELIYQAEETGILYDLEYYEEYDAYMIYFMLTSAKDTLYAAQNGILEAEQKWNNLVNTILAWNYRAYEHIKGRHSNAWCYITVYDEDFNVLMESRNGTLLSNIID